VRSNLPPSHAHVQHQISSRQKGETFPSLIRLFTTDSFEVAAAAPAGFTSAACVFPYSFLGPSLRSTAVYRLSADALHGPT
jgi:hypothetical protein